MINISTLLANNKILIVGNLDSLIQMVNDLILVVADGKA
jgi:hypothetical protein